MYKIVKVVLSRDVKSQKIVYFAHQKRKKWWEKRLTSLAWLTKL